MLQSAAYGIPDVVTRQLSMGTPLITTYLLRRAGDSLPETLSAFIDRAIRELGEDGYRSEEHTSELQSLMRLSYAVFCLKKHKDARLRLDRNERPKSQIENTRETPTTQPRTTVPI